MPEISAWAVYRDESFHTNWISHEGSRQIASFLVKRGFSEIDAAGLPIWIESAIASVWCRHAVLVMSQDIAPWSAYKKFQVSTLLRRFLDKGGRLVWIGDVPFYKVGGDSRPGPAGTGRADPDLVGPVGQYFVLGTVSAQVVPNGLVKLTKRGRKAGLSAPWQSLRPVSKKYLKRREILATTRILSRVSIYDIDPQRIETDQRESAFASLARVNQLMDSILSFSIVIGGTITTAFLLMADLKTTKAQDLGAVLLPLLVFFGSIFGALLVSRSRRTYASAWIDRFENGGEFVRLWDTWDIEFNDDTLGQLYAVSTNGRNCRT